MALAAAASLAGAVPAAAQAITGTVTSGTKAIVGATVQLGEIDRAVRTGRHGEFAFRDLPKGTYHLFVSAIGFATASRPVTVAGDTTTLTFELTPSAIRVNDVVVSATPDARASDDQYQSVSSRSFLDLQDSPGASFAEKISDLPGVTVRGNGSAPTRPILRGLGDNEVLVLENGLRVGDIATYDPAHATPIEAIGISRVDVVRGPAAILYGPNTIGGLVNVITDLVPTVADHPISGTTALEGNSVSDQYAGAVNTTYSTRHSAFKLSAGGVHGSDIRIPAGRYTDPGTGGSFELDRMPQTFDRSSEVGAGYALEGSRGMIGFGAKHYEMNYGVPGTPPNPNWDSIPPTTSRIAQTRNTIELRGLLGVSGGFADQLRFNA
ncbi:MAG: TonB-dependent receptor plug domain-containing protein, partial [Gemmatimonadales bacterium]